MSTELEASGSKLDAVKWLVVVVLLVAATLGNQYAAEASVWLRVGGVVLACLVALLLAWTTSQGRSLVELSKKSWTEAQRIVWPSKDETWQTTLIVLAVVLVSSLLLWGIDSLFGWGISAIIG
ncbi:MAG TPA: preprotein translocase subunit SecE [Candidatus Kapabacteria bacterium]|nr:preprotein translocase subunit SecE [Candidatus Kapabacteria bacterium]